MKRCRTIPAAALLLLSAAVVWQMPDAVLSQSLGNIVVGDFSSGESGGPLPAGWQAFTFDKIPEHTHYESVKEGETVVIRARSNASASGLIRKIEIDPREYPLVEWQWKVAGVLKKGDARSKKGDDYAARIYIAFAHDPSLLSFAERMKSRAVRLVRGEYPPSAVLNYIWANKVPVNTLTPNPYTGRAAMIAVQSGEGQAGQWKKERRNLLVDFREAFKAEPPMVTGVAIMTDTDNTGESATAWYGDIVFRKE